MATFYKVVRATNGRKYSVVDRELEYFTDRVTIPRLGKIFVFGTETAAEHFLWNEINHIPYHEKALELWECEAENPLPLSIRARHDYRRFWSEIYPSYVENPDFYKFIPHTNPRIGSAPTGTWVADSVRLTHLKKLIPIAEELWPYRKG